VQAPAVGRQEGGVDHLPHQRVAERHGGVRTHGHHPALHGRAEVVLHLCGGPAEDVADRGQVRIPAQDRDDLQHPTSPLGKGAEPRADDLGQRGRHGLPVEHPRQRLFGEQRVPVGVLVDALHFLGRQGSLQQPVEVLGGLPLVHPLQGQHGHPREPHQLGVPVA
jgi:hypothetical protein